MKITAKFTHILTGDIKKCVETTVMKPALCLVPRTDISPKAMSGVTIISKMAEKAIMGSIVFMVDFFRKNIINIIPIPMEPIPDKARARNTHLLVMIGFSSSDKVAIFDVSNISEPKK